MNSSNNNVMSTGIACEIDVEVVEKKIDDLSIMNLTASVSFLT